MVKEIETHGFQDFINSVQSPDLKDKVVFCLFCGDKDKDGKSWCPDCVTSEPVVRSCISKIENDDVVFIYCAVGGRDFWKDRQNEFRTHASLKLTGVPTFMRWGFPKQKLVEEQLVKEDMISMLIEEYL